MSLNPTLAGIGTWRVSLRLRREAAGGPIEGRRLDFAIPAPSHCIARVIGGELGRTIVASLAASAGEVWAFDPDRDVTAELATGATGAEQEAARADQYARVLAALVTKYGPVSLSGDDLSTAVPADVAEAQAAEGGDVWFVAPHPDRPALPDNGMVAAPDLDLHRGRYVLVPTDLDAVNPSGPSNWSWRVILGVSDHVGEPTQVLLHTPAGVQPIARASLLSVRGPR